MKSRTRRWSPLSLILFYLATLLPAFSQEQLTLEDIFASRTFRSSSFGGAWTDDDAVMTFIERDREANASHIVHYDVQHSVRDTLLGGDKLLAVDVDRAINIESYSMSQDGSKVLIFTDAERVWRAKTKGYYYVYDYDCDCLTSVSEREKGYQMFAKFSPDGKYVGFVRNRNLFLVETNTMLETQLTHDGSDGGIINGTTDWVYEEELFLRDGWAWSPDSRYIAFLQLDESPVDEFVMADLRGLKPELTEFKFPLAGEANSEIRVGVIDIKTWEKKFFDTDTWLEGGDQHEYIVRFGWTPKIDGKHRVWMFRLNRAQDGLDLIYGDPRNGKIQIVHEETEETWLEFFDREPSESKLTYLDDGKHFIWRSQVSGFDHLYLYKNDGAFVRQLTEGDWHVTAFHGIDDADRLYFTSTAESPRERHLYRLPLSASNGSTPEQITKARGVHDISMSANMEFYIDAYSNINTPKVWRLHTRDGELVEMLEDNAKLKDTLAAYDLPEYEFTMVPSADSVTSLHAYMLKPTDFYPEQAYPLIIYTYGGPWAQSVKDSWGSIFALYHSYLVEKHDLIVACVDNRGSAGRSKAFAAALYKQMGTVEPQDQIAAAQHWGNLPYIDADRIGIWGWSYGGYNTLNSMLKYAGPQTFKAGVAVAAGTDWRLYDTIYTERYMSTPDKNPEGYAQANPANFADRMRDEQALLIVQGDLDDNVHLANAMHMVLALQKANKQFELMIYPGGDHGLRGTGNRFTYLHLMTMMENFWLENL